MLRALPILLLFVVSGYAHSFVVSITDGNGFIYDAGQICQRFSSVNMEEANGSRITLRGSNCSTPAGSGGGETTPPVTGEDAPRVFIGNLGVSRTGPTEYSSTPSSNHNYVIEATDNGIHNIPLSFMAKSPYTIAFPDGMNAIHGGKQVGAFGVSDDRQKITFRAQRATLEQSDPVTVSVRYVIKDAINREVDGQVSINYRPFSSIADSGTPSSGDSTLTAEECRGQENTSEGKLCWGVNTGTDAVFRDYRAMLTGNIYRDVDIWRHGGYQNKDGMRLGLYHPDEVAMRIRFSDEEWQMLNYGLVISVEGGVSKWVTVSDKPFGNIRAGANFCQMLVGTNERSLRVGVEGRTSDLCRIDPNRDYWISIRPDVVSGGSGTDTEMRLRIQRRGSL